MSKKNKISGRYDPSPEKRFLARMALIEKAGVAGPSHPTHTWQRNDILENLDDRISRVLGIFRNKSKNPRNMIYFIMYDIENNKIRNYIAKYLERKGCIRVQKSIFIAESARKKFEEIHETLREVQGKYDNNDSIFLIPVSTDHLRAMKIIGQQVDFNMIVDPKNTMFF